MSRDLSNAFGHPELRADESGPGGLHDRISLRDHVVTVEIGAFQQERGTTQRVQFNLVVEVAPQTGLGDDDVDRILSYDTLTEAIAHELAAERLNLLETLAERIALRVLSAPKALRCFVRIEKLDRGSGALGVEIVRTRGDLPRTATAQETAHPLVVYLSNAAMASGRIITWLDELAGADIPVILCVGASETQAPAAKVLAAQRRIDLLAIEQNAWVLAGLDRRCVVVGSRTELTWAMKHGVITVWAPSKIVLDSADAPERLPLRGVDLAVWFATAMNAARFITLGAPAPDDGALTCTELAADAPRILME